jgi:phosphatidylglycerol:prolipoprotein diacylglycerol transferase
MLVAPNIDPVAISLGPLKIHWYGLMYVLGFIAVWWFGTRRAKQPGSGWTEQQVSDAIFYGALGVILGGRIGYVLFYNLPHYLAHPLDVFAVWQGGMSFHGGLIGVLLAMWWFARRTGKQVLAVTDFIAPWVPIGLAAGRIGNFINHELWGRVTDVPWGMVFPNAGLEPRHPSQLYEFGLEGVTLFVILWLYSARPRPVGAVSGVFLLFYGLFRFLVEFVREPDPQLGYILGPLTMGQLLSLPMIVLGIVLVRRAYKAAV